MVVVAVADQNEICLHFPCLFAGEGVSSQEGVDQDFRLGIFQQETGMTQKLNPHEHLPFLMDSQKQPASACSLIRLILRQTALGTFFASLARVSPVKEGNPRRLPENYRQRDCQPKKEV